MYLFSKCVPFFYWIRKNPENYLFILQEQESAKAFRKDNWKLDYRSACSTEGYMESKCIKD